MCPKDEDVDMPQIGSLSSGPAVTAQAGLDPKYLHSAGFMPKYPSASLTIGVVLKGLIDKGLIYYNNGECVLTPFGKDLAARYELSLKSEQQNVVGPMNLKIDF